MSDTTTEGVKIQIASRYIPGRSDPEKPMYFFAYRVHIQNEGATPVTLVSRHWIITNADGEVDEVRGPGVVGEHPRLEPGDSFEYTSACPLPTPLGTMHGSYQMRRDDESEFDAVIAPFRLVVPRLLN